MSSSISLVIVWVWWCYSSLVFPLCTGYRSVPLKNSYNEDLELASLLVHMDIVRGRVRVLQYSLKHNTHTVHTSFIGPPLMWSQAYINVGYFTQTVTLVMPT